MEITVCAAGARATLTDLKGAQRSFLSKIIPSLKTSGASADIQLVPAEHPLRSTVWQPVEPAGPASVYTRPGPAGLRAGRAPPGAGGQWGAAQAKAGRRRAPGRVRESARGPRELRKQGHVVQTSESTLRVWAGMAGAGGHPGVSLAVRGRVVHWGRAARAAVRQGEAQRNSRRRRPWGGREAGGPLGRHQAWV